MELKGKTIAVMEDDELIAGMYQESFERAGAKVVLAKDGEEGLRAIQAERPDVILTDLAMPKMDGYEFIERISKDSSLKGIPIFITTNLSTQSIKDKEVLDTLGVSGYIAKAEVKPQELIDMVRAAL